MASDIVAIIIDGYNIHDLHLNVFNIYKWCLVIFNLVVFLLLNCCLYNGYFIYTPNMKLFSSWYKTQ